jgi:hypothetical protein
MTARQIRDAARPPFEPFRLHLSDGTSHDVRHPDMILVGVRTTMIGIPAPDDPELAERMIRIANEHVTQIVPLAAERPAAG